MKILLAEDNPDDVFLFEQAVRKSEAPIKLQCVGDGVEAVSYLQGEGAFQNRDEFPLPDVLLLDLNMPRMNGFEVLEWVRKNESCQMLMVHILSSSCRESDVRRAYDLHANTYVMKPSRIDELITFVKVLHQWHGFSCQIRL